MASSGRLRVAMVHGPQPPHLDGVSDYVAHLIEALAEVDVDAAGVPVQPVDSGRWRGAALRTGRVVRQLRPHLVHVQFAPSAYRFSALPGLLPLVLPDRVPTVTTVHEYGWWAVPAWVPDVVWRALEVLRVWDRETGRLVPSGRAVIVTNPAHGRQVLRRTGKRAVEIPLAPNVVGGGPDPQARGRVRRRLGLPAESFLVVFFGFVHPVKGVRYVLEALPSLLAQRPDLHFAVVGGFTSAALPELQALAFRAELDRLAEGYGVGSAVSFTGHLPASAVSEVLRAADAAVLPFTTGVSLKSGALLAALAHGVPTAATLTDDPDPLLTDGDTVAVIARPRDATAITGTLGRLLVDEDLRRRLSAGGAALAEGRSWSRVAAAHRALYDEVLGSRR